MERERGGTAHSDVRSLFDVKGRVALVTGGRRGLGRAMALGLAEAGARLAVVARSSEAHGLEREISDRGGELLYLQADLSDRVQRRDIVKTVVSHYGRLDILVNNAGFQHRAPAAEYAPKQWDLDVEVMLTAVLDLSQQAVRVMSEQGGGQIVQIASVSSFQGARNVIGYSTVKHGLVGLTKCLANEWAPLGVRVNAIAPGLFDTGVSSHQSGDPARLAELTGRIPAGRFGRPDDLVGPLLFLVSDASRHIHGTVLLVDGGWMGR